MICCTCNMQLETFNRVLAEELNCFLASHADACASSNRSSTSAEIDVVSSRDYCGMLCTASHDNATSTVKIEARWPAQFGLNARDISTHLQSSAPEEIEVARVDDVAIQCTWQVGTTKPSSSQDYCTQVLWLSSIRYHIISCEIRRQVGGCLSEEKRAPVLHCLHKHMYALTVVLQKRLLVIYPLSARGQADEAFLRNFVGSLTEANVKDAPKCAFWEPKNPPSEVQAFQQLKDCASLGFLTMTFNQHDLIGPRLERSLHKIVFFPDTVDYAIISCKMLMHAEMRRAFGEYRQRFAKQAPKRI